MSYVVLDFETYFDKEYSLRKMTPVEYILDPRFEILGCAIIDELAIQPDGSSGPAPFWLDDDNLTHYLRGLRFREGLVTISHNALFDNCLLAWRYNIVPELMIDTMGMARAIIAPFLHGVSLDKCAQFYQLPAKDKWALKSGFKKSDYKLNGAWDQLVAYAKHDAWLCEEIFRELAKYFPKEEYKVLDMVLRMAVLPRFKIDGDLLAQHRDYIARQKHNLLVKCGMLDRMDLMSNDKFADALRRLGVTPGEKVSGRTNKSTYAFAKTDPFMIELEDHPDPNVQALHAARIGHKSTLEETRVERLLNISRLQWPDGSYGWMPIPLRYSGAHTHRLSGDWKLNEQNLAKFTHWEDGTKSTGLLRLAHVAPEGYVVVKADASQIEARIVAWLAGAEKLVQAFRDKRDIYSEFAEEWIYHYPVNKTTEDERFTGKNTILGAGFGMGPGTFQKNIAAISYAVLGRSIQISLETANAAIYGYRKAYPEIPMAWKTCNRLLQSMTNPKCHEEFGPVIVQHECVVLPSGLCLHYPRLQYDPMAKDGDGSWVCKSGAETKTLFGGKLYENIVQALARILTMSAALRMQKRYPQYPLAHQEHDALTYIVPEDEADKFKLALSEEMATGLRWSEGLPLASEVGVGPNYGDLK